MNNKSNKEKLILGGVAIVSIIFISCISLFTYNLIFGEKTEKVTTKVKIKELEGFGKTPQEALSKFIYISGNMGDPSSVTSEMIKNSSALTNNYTRRYESYEKSVEGLATDSPILFTGADIIIKKYTKTLQWPEYFSVDENSIKTTSASDEYEIETATNESGKYNAVDLYATFTSKYNYFRSKSTDVDSDGSYIQLQSTELFEHVKFILVEVSKDNWRVYDCDEKEKISARFSTWNTTSKFTFENAEEIKKLNKK